MNRQRTVMAGMLILLMVASAPTVAAQGHDLASGQTYSGDDAYDPAAGGRSGLSVVALPERPAPASANTSGSDTLGRFHRAKPISDPANGAWNAAEAEFYVAAYGAYGLAAVGVPGSSVSAAPSSAERTGLAVDGGYSGDDPYDPAAGGTPELWIIASDTGVRPLSACALSTDEIAARSARTVEGGFSGDDDYDPAAGGTPELSLLAFVKDANWVAACIPVEFGN